MIRVILAATTLTALALPAQAQRLDTRRTPIGEPASSKACIFTAYPELRLLAIGASDRHTAFWSKAADGNDKYPRILLIFGSSERDPSTPSIVGISFTFAPEEALNPEGLTGAIVRIPGIQLMLARFKGPRAKLSFFITNNVQETGTAMIASDSIQVDMLGAGDAVVRSYSWDTHRLEDAAETASVVGWSCATP